MDDKVFETDDLKLVAYLICCKFKMATAPSLRGASVFFTFTYDPQIEVEAENFKHNITRPEISLTRYATALTHVKKMTHHYKNIDLIGGGRK